MMNLKVLMFNFLIILFAMMKSFVLTEPLFTRLKDFSRDLPTNLITSKSEFDQFFSLNQKSLVRCSDHFLPFITTIVSTL